mmetsp:Transcript_76343/g.210757  ORF Transcript_76343/g.210757 Transcript_76343/m.210757 type:complete len:269 (+) Transcript_76343:442-1248(+)
MCPHPSVGCVRRGLRRCHGAAPLGTAATAVATAAPFLGSTACHGAVARPARSGAVPDADIPTAPAMAAGPGAAGQAGAPAADTPGARAMAAAGAEGRGAAGGSVAADPQRSDHAGGPQHPVRLDEGRARGRVARGRQVRLLAPPEPDRQTGLPWHGVHQLREARVRCGVLHALGPPALVQVDRDDAPQRGGGRAAGPVPEPSPLRPRRPGARRRPVRQHASRLLRRRPCKHWRHQGLVAAGPHGRGPASARERRPITQPPAPAHQLSH